MSIQYDFYGIPFEYDDKDEELRQQKIAARDAKTGCRNGDYIIFPSGETRRVSYHWGDSVQTSKGGSWYISTCGASGFSGGLYMAVPIDTLTDTGEIRDAEFWFFHHDQSGAGRGVYVQMPCRVFTCSVDAPVR